MLRAKEKITILSAAADALETDPVPAYDLPDPTLAADQHTLVSVYGLYVGDKQFLWDNRVHKGLAGFEVITPVRTTNGLVLVNRGWVPPGRTRADLPLVVLSADTENNNAYLVGLFSRPSKGFLNGEAFDTNASWPRVLQYFDYAAIEAALGEPVLAGVVQPQSINSVLNDNAPNEFYTANWEPTAAIGPTRHYGYAFQWYAMAFALFVLFVVYNTKRIKFDTN